MLTEIEQCFQFVKKILQNDKSNMEQSASIVSYYRLNGMLTYQNEI